MQEQIFHIIKNKYANRLETNGIEQRRLDSRLQTIMGIECLIPGVASLTVDCRGVNISLTIKPIWSFQTTRVSGCNTL